MPSNSAAIAPFLAAAWFAIRAGSLPPTSSSSVPPVSFSNSAALAPFLAAAWFAIRAGLLPPPSSSSVPPVSFRTQESTSVIMTLQLTI
ncbi:hypothetical protein FRC01_003196 [Tulasnella sp. 417]|nr:hypothetical protein FRC01_003196 [Tulasnella sp. 417]